MKGGCDLAVAAALHLLGTFVKITRSLPQRRTEDAATGVEYALLVALIAAVIIGTVVIFGGAVADLYDTVIGKF